MKNKLTLALSGLALIASTSSCAGLKKPVLQKVSSSYEQCIDGMYDNDTRCFEGPIAEMYDSVYPVQFDTMLEDKTIGFEARIINGAGTGLLFGNGYLLTAYHLGHINNPEILALGNIRVDVYLATQNKRYLLETVAEDKDLDLLLMKAKEDTPSLTHYQGKVGNSDNLELGNTIYLVGNSMGTGINIRQGIISQTNVDPLLPIHKMKMIGVSSGGNAGDSGGPVFALRDGKPELTGMLIVISNNDNVAYIAPINTHLQKLDHLLGDKNPIKR